MDQTTFSQALAKLTAIPAAQAAQAKVAANSLSESERDVFLHKLVSINEELQAAAKEEIKALEAFEVSLIGFEKHLNRSLRSSAERKERRKETRKAEQKLKKYS